MQRFNCYSKFASLESLFVWKLGLRVQRLVHIFSFNIPQSFHIKEPFAFINNFLRISLQQPVPKRAVCKIISSSQPDFLSKQVQEAHLKLYFRRDMMDKPTKILSI